MDLQRVIYQSRAVVTASQTLALADILAVSQRNDARDDITGALAIAPEAFLQVIEGRAGIVAALMNRVYGDPRHLDLRVLAWTAIDQRLFSGWSMIVASMGTPLMDILVPQQPGSTAPGVTEILLTLHAHLGAPPDGGMTRC